MPKLRTTKRFEKKIKKLLKKNPVLKKRITIVFKCLRTTPFNNSIKTHKVNSRIYGIAYSSSVTGDLRIIWNFDQNDKIIILLLDIGGHSGKNKVYK